MATREHKQPRYPRANGRFVSVAMFLTSSPIVLEGLGVHIKRALADVKI